MTPIFLHITSTGQIWASCDQNDNPAGTVIAVERVSPNTALTLVTTLTGSGNSSASALASSVNTGKQGSEITKTK
jgi:hypothetical protein